MRIICCGTVFVFGYNAVCSIMKGLGDSKSSLYFIAAAAVVNILLDLLLVGPFGMGTAGAAYATVLLTGYLPCNIHMLSEKENFYLSVQAENFAVQTEKSGCCLKSRTAHSGSNGSCEYLLSYDYRHVEPIRGVCCRGIRVGLKVEYLWQECPAGQSARL